MEGRGKGGGVLLEPQEGQAREELQEGNREELRGAIREGEGRLGKLR